MRMKYLKSSFESKYRSEIDKFQIFQLQKVNYSA